MKAGFPFLLLIEIILVSCQNTLAVPIPSKLFGDHAVLQRGVPVLIWGSADPGEKVKVSFGKESAIAVADGSGYWRTTLPSMAGGQNGDLVFEGKQVVKSSDVVTGDVWLCAGQSNIEFPLRLAAFANKEISEAKFPKIRQFKVVPCSASGPTGELQGSWTVCSPEKAGEFSAVGYYMARALFQKSGMPEGLINCTRGGTCIESWMSKDSLWSQKECRVAFDRQRKLEEEYPAKKEVFEKAMSLWQEEKQKAQEAGATFSTKKPVAPRGGPDDINRCSACFNGMVNPLIPVSTQGVVWYQGENNWEHPGEYRHYLQTMIVDWRSRWGCPQLPFLIVQLPNYMGSVSALDTHWAMLREGQAAVNLPGTGMVVTMDVGDPKEIHYGNKKPVGERLALLTRRMVFGEKVIDAGPTFISATKEQDAMRVTFDDGGSPIVLRLSASPWRSFELAGQDQKFHAATAELRGKNVIVRCAEVPNPIALRYCWRFNPEPIVFNEAGLPAAPFRTDDWVDAK